MPGNDSGSSPSRLPTSGGLPLGFVALAALVYALSPAGSSRQTAGSEAPKPAETPSLRKGPLKPLYEFLDVEKGVVRHVPDGAAAGHPTKSSSSLPPCPTPSTRTALRPILRSGGGCHPARSAEHRPHAGSLLDALEKREPQSRWDLSPSPSDTPEALVSVTARSKPGDSHRKNPGTLLFRSPDPGKLFVVFLVGEVPTWGVQREALDGRSERDRGERAGGENPTPV